MKRLGKFLTNTVAGGGGPTYSAEATAYFAAMSVEPDATRKGHLDALISGLKTDGVWSKLTWLSIMAAHDAQAARVNAVTPAQVATAVNSPTFTTDRGYAGDGATSYLSTGVAGTAIADDNCSAFAFIDTLPTLTFRGIWGYDTRCGLVVHVSGAASSQGRLKANASSVGTSNNLDDMFVAMSRTGTTQIWRRETTTEDTDTVATDAFNEANIIRILSNVSTFSNALVSISGFGQHLTTAELDNLRTRIRTYLTAVGAI